jgi:phage terminase large subunit-like protein
MEQRSLIDSLRNSLPILHRKGKINDLLASLPQQSKEHLVRRWPVWARHQQLPDLAPWTNWLLLGGRGAGKTRAGSEWTRGMATGDMYFTQQPVGQIALVAETYADAREVMVEGQSGLLAVHKKAERPVWTSSRRRLEWPNGAVAQVFSSEDPDALRGPQFGAAWCDAKTIWGTVISLLAVIATAFGVDIDEQSQQAFVEMALQLVAVGGSLFAMLGRLSATSLLE